MNLRPRAGLAAGLLGLGISLAAASPAPAKVPVDLRIEGPTRTLFEGRIATPVRTFRFTNERTRHRCDGTAVVGGPSARPVATRGGAIDEAAERFGFSLRGKWFEGLGATFERIAGEDVAFDPTTNRYLVEYENGLPTELGSCADPIRPGDDVLFAYGTGSETLLALSGPRTAAPQDRVTMRVTNARTQAPVAGATVRGVVTGPAGLATVGPFERAGYHALKARQPGAIRSNRLRLCVTSGTDGACAPLDRITDIRDGQRFRRSNAPRRLRGVIEAAPFGVKRLQLRLTRQRGGRWYVYSAAQRRFVRRPAGTRRAFAIRRSRDWSYRLPSRLGRGRYVLDALATDRNGNRDRVERGRSRMVFSVR